MALADTSFLIDLLAGQEDAQAKLGKLIEIGEPVWVPSIALHELSYGARLHEEAERETERIRKLEAALPPVAFTAEAARTAGRLEADGELDGRRSGRADAQIAAQAMARGETLVTADEDLAAIDGLATETY